MIVVWTKSYLVGLMMSLILYAAAMPCLASSVYPNRVENLKFDHSRHKKIPCSSCHGATAMKVRVTQPSIPGHHQCSRCHEEIGRRPGSSACKKCHLGTPRKGLRPWSSLNFSHVVHAGIKGRCTACHVPVGPAPYPDFEKCRSCHKTLVEQGKCRVCHPERDAGRLKLHVVGGKLVPRGGHGGPDHGTGWKTNHGSVARLDSESCYRCHARRHCDTCHRGVQRSIRHHPADWEVIHGPIAKADSHRCVACHRTQTSCLKCHERTGMSPDGTAGPANKRVHPEGFGLAGRHGAEARRNINRCMSCHTESHCIACHGARGSSMRIKPHPPGFRQRCGLMRKRNSRACVKCHSLDELEVLCP